MSHNVSQTAFRSGKIHPWADPRLALLSSFFWDRLKIYIISSQLRPNRVSGLVTRYVIYYPLQYLWSLVRYPLRYKRRIFRWMFGMLQSIKTALPDEILVYLLRLFRFQYMARQSIFLSVGKFGYARKSVKERVRRIQRTSNFFHRHFLFRDRRLRFNIVKTFPERFFSTLLADSFSKQMTYRKWLSRFQPKLIRGRVEKYMSRLFGWSTLVRKELFYKGLNLFKHPIFRQQKLLAKRHIKRMYWLMFRLEYLGKHARAPYLQRFWIRYFKPRLKWYKYRRRRLLLATRTNLIRGIRGKRRENKRRVVMVPPRHAARVWIDAHLQVRDSTRRTFNFIRKSRVHSFLDEARNVSTLLNADFNIKKLNVFRYLRMNPRYNWKKRWKQLFWYNKFWRQRRQYPAYFDLINSVLLQTYFRNLGFLFLQVVCLILRKYDLKRGIVLFWFINFLGTLVTDLPQVKAVFALFRIVMTGKIKGGTFRTSRLQAGFGDLARQSLSDNLQYYFASLNASAGLFGLKLLMQRHNVY